MRMYELYIHTARQGGLIRELAASIWPEGELLALSRQTAVLQLPEAPEDSLDAYHELIMSDVSQPFTIALFTPQSRSLIGRKWLCRALERLPFGHYADDSVLYALNKHFANARKEFRRRLENRISKHLLESALALAHADLNATLAAKRLYVHRNTLLYRLRQFKLQTGLDPQRFRTAALLDLLYTL